MTNRFGSTYGARGRIAVTGVGITSALGATARETFARVLQGDVGFSEVSLFDTTGQRSRLAAEIRGFRVEDVVPRGEAARWSRSDALALAAAHDAFATAGLGAAALRSDAGRLGIAVGITTGGMLEAEDVLARLPEPPTAPGMKGGVERLVSYPLSSTAERLSEVFGPAQRVATLCSACSSGANAIVQGICWLGLESAERVLVGGTDALCRLTFTGFNALGATDVAPCRPFDRARAGLTLGEGAAFLVLETERAVLARGAPVLAWLSGWAVGAEAHHVTQPEPRARMPERLLRVAIERAGLSPGDIDYVNAHGTGTQSNDVVETLAIRTAFGADADRVLVSSSKGQLGHTLGAASAVEAAITVLSLSRQEVPPTGGLRDPDDACRLQHVTGRGRPSTVRAAASNSFGFGGTGAVLVFERSDAERREARGSAVATGVVVTGLSVVGARGVVEGDAVAVPPAVPVSMDPAEPLSSGADRFPLARLDPGRSRRFDVHSALVTLGAEGALRSAGLPPGAAGLVSGIAFGNVARTVTFLRTAFDKGPRRAPPAEFPHLVPSAPTGNTSIYLGLLGPVLSECRLGVSAEAAVAVACDWVEGGLSSAVIAGGAEPFDPFVEGVLGPACAGAAGVPRVATHEEGGAFVTVESAEHAHARGATAYAAVQRRYELPLVALSTSGTERIAPPGDPQRAIVVSARPIDGLAFLLDRSGWSPARRLSPAVRSREAAGGVSLAVAAALVFRGEATDALVVAGGPGAILAFHLTAVLPGPGAAESARPPGSR